MDIPGYKTKLYYGTAGVEATTLIENVTDVDYNMEAEKAETTVKGTGASPPVVTEEVVAIKPTITFTMMYSTTDSVMTALLAAAATGALVALRTKNHTSGTGFDGDCSLSVRNATPLKGMETYEFTATASKSLRTPQLDA